MEPTVAYQPERARTDLLTPILLALLVTGSIVFLWFSASADEIYMTVYVTAAVVWVGGGTALTIFAFLTERARDPHALANLVTQVEKIGLSSPRPRSSRSLSASL